MISETFFCLYTTNEEAWDSLLEDCKKAEKTIDLEQFIFVADDFGNKLIDICSERAKAGVKVRFLWDAAGSFSFFGSTIAEDLQKKGIELVFWKTLIPGFFKVPNYRSWFFRNHRRTIVIDNKIGYTGSICIRKSSVKWRDTNLRLEGPVVSEMSNAFNRMWGRAKGDKNIAKRQFVRDREFKYITNYPTPGRRHIYTELVAAIRSAKKFVYISTPFFVPTHRLLRVIKLAAHRGVDVRLLLPEKSDKYPTLDFGAKSYFDTLLKSGVRIFLYQDNNMHSKTTSIDGDWATVGTLNLDRLSLLYNFEANIITTNGRFAEEVESHFIHDMQNSREILLTEWRKRSFIEKIPEVLIKLVRKFL
ncbi:MAG: phospholipase D-like domain-containing protein [Patescibacteria group bacterium]